ncbi:orotidine 5'-phosphate decarboxylase [Terrihabitans soli]|uniref:Orotidine 5'-phosphate decarboxylase n=1 Tax=Terrihabitans soli TaxID=708113 RepID=A0A6S6QZ68_9HYPH|nr:orotidine-5'-phosphate decarboxylase [Terrihabitans soli]BCJ92390.1 orotidine 5'-phosphate decarboxylase [Terrihabitans soli]
MTKIPARDRLIVALDLADVTAAERAVRTLGDSVAFYKIGYELGFVGGLTLAEKLAGEGKQIFLDFKLHDIGNTVARGVASLARIGATFLTVHAYPQTMRAAVEGRGDADVKLLAVTALTSYDDADAAEAGYGLAIRDLVRLRAEQARTIGLDGIVCSAAETSLVRDAAGPSLAIVTPGIRPAGSAAGDQKRTLTPAEAISAGVDYLVVGRPIMAAKDPKAAADSIVAEIETAL